MSRLTPNNILKEWVAVIQDAPSEMGAYLRVEGYSGSEAGMVETVVGGAFTSILALMYLSNIQYSALPALMTADSTVSVDQLHPPKLMPERAIECNYQNRTAVVYRRVYGYKLNSLPTILSIVVLFVYCFVAIWGSVRQCVSGSIMKSWTTVAEYGSLCLGTDSEKAIRNTCAGIGSDDRLRIVVGIRESGIAGQESGSGKHLELVVSKQELELKPKIGKTSTQYGIPTVSKAVTIDTGPTTTPSPPLLQ